MVASLNRYRAGVSPSSSRGSALRRRGVRRDCPVRLDGTSQRRDDIDLGLRERRERLRGVRVERGLGVSDARGQQVDEVVERDSRDRLGRSSGAVLRGGR